MEESSYPQNSGTSNKDENKRACTSLPLFFDRVSFIWLRIEIEYSSLERCTQYLIVSSTIKLKEQNTRTVLPKHSIQ